jgi:hypothetical protein
MLLKVGQHGLQVGWHQLEHRHAALDDRGDEPGEVEDHLLLDQEGPPTDEERGDQLPQ